jgi:hypothetical protein
MQQIKIISKDESLKLNTLQSGCGCSAPAESALMKKVSPDKMPSYATGIINTSIGEVLQVSSEWKRSDYWGQIKSRSTAFRMEYSVEPGIYALGNPDANSDVFVTCNYKLSFDILRRELKSMNAWILILETFSINVWCAAGKGTFGTEEIIKRINLTKLSSIVDHKRIILPQLGAPGVNADQVRKATGFKVLFGPVQASDIPEYIAQNYKATKEMRTIKFNMADRLILTPIELNPSFKAFPKYAVIFLLILGLQSNGIIFKDSLQYGLPVLLLLISAIFSGAFITPVLLPFIPFRSFAIKGWIVGIITTALILNFGGIIKQDDIIMTAFSYTLFPVISSYLGLNFTGATTFTNISGVKKEIKFAMPIIKVLIVLSFVILIIFKVKQWGLI